MKKDLVKAITLGLLLGFSTTLGSSTAYAEIDENGLQSTREEIISIDGAPFVKLDYFENGTIKSNGEDVQLTVMDAASYRKSIQEAMQYWGQVLGYPKAGVPELYVYGRDLEAINASAGSSFETINGISATKLAHYFLQDEYNPAKPIANIQINVGYNDWDYGDLCILPQSTNTNLPTVIVHEMFHALGILSAKKVVYDLDYLAEYSYYGTGVLNSDYDSHLRDIYGHTLSDCDYFGIIDKQHQAEPDEIYDEAFYININSDEKKAYDSRYGGTYFTGENVLKVLNGAMLAWPDDGNGELERVPGIPINGVTLVHSQGYMDFELSHFELQNSLQSHQHYRNWAIPMEVELAALKDLGYNINLGNFYGRSIYNDNLKLTNDLGYDKEQNCGIGLHIYGIGNDVTQVGNINATGAYAMGARIDGAGYSEGAAGYPVMEQGNRLTVASGTTIAANGYNGRGINFAYGKNHSLTVDGTVTALGTGGRAICFDFGNNALSNDTEYRGSYLRSSAGKSKDLLTSLKGPLVTEANINGTVAGNSAAVYINNNALVKAINVNDGATVVGDIISDWKNTGVLGLQLPAEEDGMTTINFGACGYGGNISNSEGEVASSLNMNIKGNMDYLGTAKVNRVSVASGARLMGGSYEATQGLVNAGTIGAVLPTTSNTTMTINGDLLLKDKSSVQFTGNVLNNSPLTGVVAVNGKVTQEGAVNVTVDSNGKYLPGSYSVLLENGADVALNVTDSKASVYERGLLQAVYDTDAKNIVFSARSDDKLSGDQNKAVAALTDAFPVNSSNYQGLSDMEKERYVTLLNTSDEGLIQRSTQELTSNKNAQLAQAVQKSNLTGRMVGARLASVNAKTVSVPIKVEPKALVKNNDVEKQAAVVNIDVPLEKENSFWGKVDKGWGKAGVVNSHSSALVFGYDKKYDAHNRAGVMLSYATSSAATTAKHDNTKDYRLGLYNGYHKGANEVAVYVDYGRQRHTAKGSTYLNPSYRNDYGSRVLELGAEYKYNLHSEDNKLFHVSPYANAQVSRMWQDGYKEGALGQNVHKHSSNYLATELGLEIARQLPQGSYSARLGYKEVWDGASTRLNYSLGTVDFVSESRLDKHFVTASLSGSAKLQHGWSLEGEARIEKGAHDRNYGTGVTLKYEW